MGLLTRSRPISNVDLESKMTDRMKRAMILAEFVEQYFEVMEAFLISRAVVMGDEFRAHCAQVGLVLPKLLHHNTWVSGVRAMHQIDWISPLYKLEPAQSHNHMPMVTLWRSNIFGDRPLPIDRKQKRLFE